MDAFVCDKCKKTVRGSHICKQCATCSRYFVKLPNHKCKYHQCIWCKKNVKITSKHSCNVPLKCGKCEYTTLDKAEMVEHRKAGHFFTCPKCDFKSGLHRVMKHHYYRKHKLGDSFSCTYCSLIFNKRERLQNHILMKHVANDLPIYESAFKKSCISYGTRFQEDKNPPLSIDSMFEKYSPQIKSILRAGISSYTSFKANVIIFAKLSKYDHVSHAPIETVEFIHQSKSVEVSCISTEADLDRYLSDIQSSAEEKFDSYCDLEGSGWTFEHVSGLFIQLGRCQSLTGGCYQECEFSSEFVWDGNSEDGECFFSAVSRHFHDRDADDETINNFAKTSFEECGKIPMMSVSRISKFEERYNLSINVLVKEEAGIYILYKTKQEDNNPINLLLIQLEEGRHHYIYITDIGGLVNEIRYLASEYVDNSEISSKKQVYPCLNCLNIFTCKQSLESHKRLCDRNKAQTVRMPKKGDRLAFSRYEARHQAPLIGAFDFESKMAKKNLQSSPISHDLSEHKIVSYSFAIVSIDNEIVFERSEMDEHNCLELFMEAVMDASRQIGDILKRTTPMDLTKEEQQDFENARTCHICGLAAFSPDKVRDHCHFSGKFIGAAHISCNLNRRSKYKIPVYAHNFSNYDAHFLLQALVNHKDYIPNLSAMCFNSQKFRSITIDKFNFLDSTQFISDSLENVSKQLYASDWGYKILKNSGLYQTQHQKELLLKKGVFPYEFLTSLRKFKRLKSFPERESFYSALHESTITVDEYNHGKQVFKEFKCENMAEYLLLYNKLDVFLLHEAISSFRALGWREFRLDPAHFISLPQYGFQS